MPIDHILQALKQVTSDTTPYSMHPTFYTNDDFLEEEIEQLFIPGWICVGRADRIANIHDYFVIEILGESLIITRNADNSISALSNVCRHRGSIIASGEGSAKKFTCPYHHWSYAQDGSLIRAPLIDEQEGFDKKTCKLPSFKTEIWMGWIFVNLSNDAPPLLSAIKPIDEFAKNYHNEEMVSIQTTDEIWATNWKCLGENFLEGYHLTPVHLTTLHPMCPTRLCEKIDGNDAFTGYKAHYVEDYEGRIETHPDMSEEQKRLSQMLWIYPGFVVAMSPNSSVWISLLPEDADHVRLHWGVIGRPEIIGTDEADARWNFANEFNAEDRARLEDVQKGLKSRFAKSGPLAPKDYEGTVMDFYTYVCNKMT